ncbi:MAG: hypothetical protein H6741_13525 [Alphaproteobacteria bacterium]|nr:hypothetical protein [Alphaproteobacteria bacterium]
MPLLLILLGCADSAVDTAPVVLDPALELGTGEIEWAPLVDGQELNVIQGPQGGFHVLASVRVGGVEAGDGDDLGSPLNPTVVFAALHGGEDITLTGEYTQGLDEIVGDAPGYSHELIGRFLILDIEADDVLDGEDLEMQVTFTDVNGLTLSDSRTVRCYPDPRNH